MITTTASVSSVLIKASDQVVTGDMSSLFTSMGVFAAALFVAYFMLRRGDKREHDLLAGAREDAMADKKALLEALALVNSLRNELESHRKNR